MMSLLDGMGLWLINIHQQLKKTTQVQRHNLSDQFTLPLREITIPLRRLYRLSKVN